MTSLDFLDGPASFMLAGETLADWCDHLISPIRAAELLSRLACAGLIVSVDMHDEIADGYAAQLSHAHTAADDLVRRLEQGGDL